MERNLTARSGEHQSLFFLSSRVARYSCTLLDQDVESVSASDRRANGSSKGGHLRVLRGETKALKMSEGRHNGGTYISKEVKGTKDNKLITDL